MGIKKSNSRILHYHEVYKKEILPLFNNFEQVRLNTLNEFKKKSLLKYLLPIIILLLLVILGKKYISDMFIYTLSIVAESILIFLIIFSYYVARKKENIKFTNMMKRKTLQPLLKVFGDIKWIGHDPTQINPNNILLTDYSIYQSGLFISYNTRYTDDEFEGTYKDVSFKISETKMFDVHGCGRNSSMISAFEGIVLSFEFNKIINNRTIVATKGDFTKKNQTLITTLVTTLLFLPYYTAGGYAHWKIVLFIIMLLGVFLVAKSNEKKEEALDEIFLEDPIFAKRFNVYSSDQVEARYLITPAFMNRFYNLKTVFGAKKAKCSFYGNTLMIAITTNKNLFEICSLFKSLKDPSSIKEFYRELNSISQIIEYFKLNEKTGM